MGVFVFGPDLAHFWPLVKIQSARLVRFESAPTPQAGIVKDIATTSQGAVMQPGMVLLNLVPVNEPLQAEVQVMNEDIGSVQKGQPAQVKVAAYPFQKYGLLQGRVQTLAPDAQPAQAPASAANPGLASAPPGYRALIQLNTQRLQDLPLDAGMQVVAAQAGRER